MFLLCTNSFTTARLKYGRPLAKRFFVRLASRYGVTTALSPRVYLNSDMFSTNHVVVAFVTLERRHDYLPSSILLSNGWLFLVSVTRS